MKNKLRKYIEQETAKYVTAKGYSDLKEELLTNSVDRFNGFIEEGLSAEEAYIETIKHIGDINSIFMLNDVSNSNLKSNFYFLLTVILLSIGNISLIIYFGDNEVFKYIFIVHLFVATIASIFFFNQIKNENNVTNSKKVEHELVFVVFYYFISMVFAIAKLIFQFHGESMYLEYISSYLLVSIILGYSFIQLCMNLILNNNEKYYNIVSNYKHVLLITLSVSLFSMINYSDSLLLGNLHLISLMLIFVYLLLIAYIKLGDKIKMSYEKTTQTITDIVIIIYIIVISLSLSKIIEFPLNFPLRIAMISYIAPLPYLIYMLFKFKDNLKLHLKKILLSYIQLFITIYIAWKIIFELRFLFITSSQIFVVPHQLKLQLSILIVSIWLIEFIKRSSFSKMLHGYNENVKHK
ncbi:MAG: hypothetical protein ABII85_04255 [Bacillota bacterium]